MFWTPLMKSFCISVALTIISNTAQISGQPRGLTLVSNAQYSGVVYTGWYSVQTPVSLLISTTGTVVTYLPSCHHSSPEAYTIELFKNEGGNKMVIAKDRVTAGFQRDTRLLWPSSSLNASDSGTYRCSFQPPTTGADSRDSYILHVVVPVNITEFNLTSQVFAKSEVEAVCCAEGYPEPVLTVTERSLTGAALNLTLTDLTKTYSDGVPTVCRYFELRAESYSKLEITCRAELGHYSCSHKPAAAYNLCRQARNETSSTKNITANVPVNITEFNSTSQVFTKSEVEAVCCAEGYPEPVLTVTERNLAGAALTLRLTDLRKTYSDGGLRVCQHFELRAESYGKFEITCRAKLGNYSCPHKPAAAYNLCRQARNETSSTKKITANEPYCTPSKPEQITNGSLDCTGHTFGSMCQCSKDYTSTDAVTICLGSGNWSSPIPKCVAMEKSSSSSTGIIAGSTIGGLGGLGVVALIVIGVYRRFYRKEPFKSGG